MNWTPVKSGTNLEDVWAMYVGSYAKIGLVVDNPEQLAREYDRWWLLLDADGRPRAFKLAKTTPFGVKAGLSGTDGSKDARRQLVADTGAWFTQPGFYGEVSHRMEEIVAAAGVPAVCTSDARRVLGKTIEPVGPIHYSRPIAGVGSVTKVMVGLPSGVQPVDYAAPVCDRTSRLSAYRRRALSVYEGRASVLFDRLADDDSLMPWMDDFP